MKKKMLKFACIQTLPVFFGYLFLGIAFGILLTSKGYHWIWTAVMSLSIYAGSMQFVAVNLLMAPFGFINTIIMTLMVNARHLFYGISLLGKFEGTGKKKPYLIFSLTDETYSLLCGIDIPKEMDEKTVYFYISILDQSYWVLGSVLGGLIGSILPFQARGVEFSMTALFVVIFMDQWQSTKNHMPAIIGVVCTLICRLLFGATQFVIPSMILIIAVVFLAKRQLEGDRLEC